jgi:hypothetical protein
MQRESERCPPGELRNGFLGSDIDGVAQSRCSGLEAFPHRLRTDWLVVSLNGLSDAVRVNYSDPADIRLSGGAPAWTFIVAWWGHGVSVLLWESFGIFNTDPVVCGLEKLIWSDLEDRVGVLTNMRKVACSCNVLSEGPTQINFSNFECRQKCTQLRLSWAQGDSKIEESQGKKEECELAEMNKIETQYSE